MPDRLANKELFQHRLYSGSVKDVFGQEGKDPYLFHFSDRYSIFDWGEMPDLLPGKGEALAMMGDLFFKFLEKSENWISWNIPESYPKFWRDSLTTSRVWSNLRKKGVNHHSFGLVDANGMACAPGTRSHLLAVKALQRLPVSSSLVNGKVHWDYSAYASKPARSLVPLEVVFRFGAPEGSSFLQRLEKIPNYAQSFGFTETPRAGDWFSFPIVEFFTKLEPSDRFLTREEAKEVAGLSQEELDSLVALTLLTALRLKDLFGSMGLELWDGKFEFSFLPGEGSHRDFMLVDSIGPDELRLIGAGGVHFSKEFLRRVYRGSEWYEGLERAKKMSKERGEKDWKKICVQELKLQPEKLPAEIFASARDLYPVLVDSLAERVLGKKIFGLPSVAELCARIKDIT